MQHIPHEWQCPRNIPFGERPELVFADLTHSHTPRWNSGPTSSWHMPSDPWFSYEMVELSSVTEPSLHRRTAQPKGGITT